MAPDRRGPGQQGSPDRASARQLLGTYYANRAANTAKADGYATPGGLVSGRDYTLTTNGTNKDTGIFSLSVRYLEPVALTEDEYFQRIMDAVEGREITVKFQYQEGDGSFETIKAAVDRIWAEEPTVNGLVYDVNYGVSLSYNERDMMCTISIWYR